MIIPLRLIAFLKATEVDASHFFTGFKPQAGSIPKIERVRKHYAIAYSKHADLFDNSPDVSSDGNVISCTGCICPQSSNVQKSNKMYYHDDDGFQHSMCSLCMHCGVDDPKLPDKNLFVPQSGSESAYAHMIDQTDVYIYKSSLPRGECSSLVSLTCDWVTMTPLYCNSELSEQDIVFPGLPVIFSLSEQRGPQSISDFILQTTFDAQKAHDLSTLADLSMCDFVPTCWGKLLLARRSKDFPMTHYVSRGFSQIGNYYALHSDSLNPMLLYYIPQEAIISAGLLLGRRPIGRLRKLLVALNDKDLFPTDGSALWMKIITNYSHQLSRHWDRGRPDVGVSDGHKQDFDKVWQNFGPQSGEAESIDLDGANDETVQAVSDSVDASDLATMDISDEQTAKTNAAHTSCTVSQTTSVSPGLSTGFGVRMAHPTSISKQDDTAPQYRTVNAGTRFERRERIER